MLDLYKATLSSTLEQAIARLKELHNVRYLDRAFERANGDDLWIDDIEYALAELFHEEVLDADERREILDNLYADGNSVFAVERTWTGDFVTTDDGDQEFEIGYCFIELAY